MGLLPVIFTMDSVISKGFFFFCDYFLFVLFVGLFCLLYRNIYPSNLKCNCVKNSFISCTYGG